MPLSIKQLNEAKDEGGVFYVDGAAIAQISLIGLVLNVEVQNTNVNYTLDDGSGSVTITHYSQEDQYNHCREDMYVKVVGNVREISGRRRVVAFQITPITDFNKITLHALDVVHTHLKNTKGSLEAKNNAPANPMMASSVSNNYVANAGGDVDDDGLEANQKQVLDVFARFSKDKEEGTSVTEVVQKLPNIDPTAIRDAVEFLSAEGHLYSTIDEEHFKCTSE